MKPLHHCSLARDCLQREPEKLVMSSAAYLAAATCRDPQKWANRAIPAPISLYARGRHLGIA